MTNVSSNIDIDSQPLLIINMLFSILLMNFNSKSILIVQFAQILKHQDSQNNYQIGLYIAGFYLGIIILKIVKRRNTSLFLNFIIGYTFYFIGQTFIFFLSFSKGTNQIENSKMYLFITLAKLCLGISNIICLIETIQQLQQSKNEEFKRVIFLVLPLLQIVSFIFTSAIYNKLYWFICSIIFIQILISFFLYYQKRYIINKQQQFQTTEQIIEESIKEDNEQNQSKQILKREVKFMKILIFLIIQITQDITFMVGIDILMLGLYLNLLHIFFYKRMNIKITLITGQFVVMLGIILAFIDFYTNIIVIIGYFIGIGSTQYYIIQKQLLPIQIIDYFETYSIFQLIQICIFDSYISNLIKFYITSNGYKLLIIIMTTTLLLLVIKKRKQKPIEVKNDIEEETVNNNEIKIENEQNSQS